MHFLYLQQNRSTQYLSVKKIRARPYGLDLIFTDLSGCWMYWGTFDGTWPCDNLPYSKRNMSDHLFLKPFAVWTCAIFGGSHRRGSVQCTCLWCTIFWCTGKNWWVWYMFMHLGDLVQHTQRLYMHTYQHAHAHIPTYNHMHTYQHINACRHMQISMVMGTCILLFVNFSSDNTHKHTIIIIN